MGYILPTIPDTLLETLKHSHSNPKAIKQVERIEQIKPIKYSQSDHEAKRKQNYFHPDKGKLFDQSV